MWRALVCYKIGNGKRNQGIAKGDYKNEQLWLEIAMEMKNIVFGLVYSKTETNAKKSRQ